MSLQDSTSHSTRDTHCHPQHVVAVQDLLVTEPDLAAGFQHTKFLVMDEADRLLEASFEADLRAILTKLPAKRQTLLFSATMTKNLVTLQKAVLRDAYHFQVSPAMPMSCPHDCAFVHECGRPAANLFRANVKLLSLSACLLLRLVQACSGPGRSCAVHAVHPWLPSPFNFGCVLRCNVTCGVCCKPADCTHLLQRQHRRENLLASM